MSGARKLQTEIDRVMKKVDEGVELFDDIYEKVYSAEQQSQKEKFEVELKKEIKKLQRLRDQIKSWISGSEVKDKDNLLEYRRLIETKMEAFKVVEKETKTKTFSKEGLARQEKLDPEEQKREETIKWISEVIDSLQTHIDEQDLEIEKLSAGRGKKTNKNQIEECNQHLLSHKFHMSKLEGIMRLVRNDRISPDTVDEVREDLEYYLESHEEDDYMMAYDEECFYDVLGLDDLDVVNVDRVTQTSVSSGKKKDDDATSASSGSKKEKKVKAGNAAFIPLTIGRARSKLDKGTASNEATPTKLARSSSNVSAGPAPVTIPAVAKAPPAPAPGGATSMAAMLKRESEERQKAQALQAAQAQQQAQQQAAELARQQQAAAAAAELLRQQQLQKQQAEALRLQQEAALRQQQQAQAQAAAQQKAEALKRQQQQQQLLEQQAAAQRQQADAAAKQKLLQQQQAQQQAAAAQAATQQAAQAQQQNVLNVGIAGLSLGGNNAIGGPNAPVSSAAGASQQQAASISAASGEVDATERYLNALNDSFLQIPTSTDSDRGGAARNYAPRNPYPSVPSCYPSSPSPIFDNPAIFSKLGTDALFFIFYYAQGTYQQYLAARELKKQSWRYHKKYMTWFQRHEEPKVTTDDYEQGTYVYFDYETGWCQRIKSDFRFEYSFLEDSLSV